MPFHLLFSPWGDGSSCWLGVVFRGVAQGPSAKRGQCRVTQFVLSRKEKTGSFGQLREPMGGAVLLVITKPLKAPLDQSSYKSLQCYRLAQVLQSQDCLQILRSHSNTFKIYLCLPAFLEPAEHIIQRLLCDPFPWEQSQVGQGLQAAPPPGLPTHPTGLQVSLPQPPFRQKANQADCPSRASSWQKLSSWFSKVFL